MSKPSYVFSSKKLASLESSIENLTETYAHKAKIKNLLAALHAPEFQEKDFVRYHHLLSALFANLTTTHPGMKSKVSMRREAILEIFSHQFKIQWREVVLAQIKHEVDEAWKRAHQQAEKNYVHKELPCMTTADALWAQFDSPEMSRRHYCLSAANEAALAYQHHHKTPVAIRKRAYQFALQTIPEVLKENSPANGAQLTSLKTATRLFKGVTLEQQTPTIPAVKIPEPS